MSLESGLFGTTESVVQEAIESGDPFPGTSGFAGELSDGGLVRDVLGRYPLFTEGDLRTWSFDPIDLSDPVGVPAGHVRTPDGDERAWTLPRPEPDPDAETRVATALETAIEAVPADAAVAFSGGVDSALVATGTPDGPLYVVGFPDCHDITSAREAARVLERDLRVVELGHDALRDAVPIVARSTGRTNAMDVSIALGLYLAGRAVAEDGYDRMVVGQGADELFGGYAKVATPDHRVDADTVRGAANEVIATLPAQLERDVLAVRAAGVEPVAPFLHDAVVEAALALPGDRLVAVNGTRKVALRAFARDRLPDVVVDREKKAMQYGTYINRELDRLARQNGFKRRMDRHVDRYVESLVPEYPNESTANDA